MSMPRAKSLGREVLALLAGRPNRRTAMTLALTAAVTTAGLAVLAALPPAPLLPAPHGYSVGLVLAAVTTAFLIAELGQALIEFREQAYSFCLAGIPMLLGLLYCPPQQLVLARVGAAAIAFAIQRAPAVKFAFNTAAFLLDTSLVMALSHLFAAGAATLNPATATQCYAALAIVDLLMSALVLLVIRINDGPVGWSDAAQVFLPTTGIVLLNTALGLVCAELLGAGSLGGTLLLLMIATITGVYRGYLVLRRKHQSLEVVQQFIEHSEDAGPVDELATRLLTEIRDLVRASRVELTFSDDDGENWVRVHSDADRTAVPRPRQPAVEENNPDTDLPSVDLTPGEAAIISSRSTDPSHRRWLHVLGARDAIVVPVARSGTRATLVAIDRLGDATRFTDDDLALLQALAGHLTVALRNTQLLQRLRHDATHDPLTGMANRSLLTDALKDALARSSDPTRPAVLLLDLDRFKEVNDALGHHVGDQLLQVVAARLTALAIPEATVARLGGDEFAILLPATTNAESAALAVAEQCAQALRAPVDLPDVTLSIEASIGVAVAMTGHTHADVLRHADTAMYSAKSTHTTIAAYTDALDAGRAERLALLADLHLALERDELDLHYQPKLNLDLNLVTSVEALVRWTHPTRGPLSPDIFIPLAESTGLIEHLTQIVLNKALRQCRNWQDAGLDLAVAVNLSARNVVNPNLPEDVTAALQSAGLPPRKLILEITESAVMGDPQQTVPTLERLAATGVTLSLDDFGTGYSSLSYLQRLPVQELKIDRSFVMGLDQEDDNHASHVLIRSIIGLGRSLGLTTVAEGVENAATLSLLRNIGCHTAQGYHIARPVPAPFLAETLARAGLATPRPTSRTASAAGMTTPH